MTSKNLLNFLGKMCKYTYKYKDDTHQNFKYLYFFFYQKLLLNNFFVPWPVHFTSYITCWEKIKFGEKCSPGSSPCQYIQASNGIIMGNNVLLAPGVHLISASHDFSNYNKDTKSPPIKIGSNVWIGSYSVILPGINIGDNVIIGAGSIVTKNIPSNSIAVGNPCKVIKNKTPYKMEQ
ncbi:MAG: DapH/DapD/GlmU-related protein [Candidatus Gracilibacteria bacterium]|nr:DapH/DapD/GlmU-related protein [Candidatus Gracilibacteria bacterium]